MTRAIYWIGIVGGLSLALSGHFELISKAFPGIGVVWEARIELVAFASATLCALFQRSPAPPQN